MSVFKKKTVKIVMNVLVGIVILSMLAFLLAPLAGHLVF